MLLCVEARRNSPDPFMGFSTGNFYAPYDLETEKKEVDPEHQRPSARLVLGAEAGGPLLIKSQPPGVHCTTNDSHCARTQEMASLPAFCREISETMRSRDSTRTPALSAGRDVNCHSYVLATSAPTHVRRLCEAFLILVAEHKVGI